MAHNLKIAGAVYSSVAKVTFTDSGGTSCAYLDADEVYTKDQAAQLIEDERNKTREYTVTQWTRGLPSGKGMKRILPMAAPHRRIPINCGWN